MSPKEALVRGSIRHETYDMINKNEERIIKSIVEKTSLKNIKENYKNEYFKFLKAAILKNKESLNQFNLSPNDVFKQTFPLILNEVESRSTRVFDFIEKYDIFGEELWERLTPKIQSEFKIRSEKIGLSGIIDQIEIYETGIVPVELKTGKTPKQGVWPGHKIQIASYAMLLENFYKKEVKEGFVIYLDTGERRHIPINAFLKLEIKELIKKVNDLFDSRKLPSLNENQNKCNVCGLKDSCFDEKKLAKLQNKKNQKL